mgnify:FL=1
MFELEAIHGGIYKYNFQSESNAQLHPLGPGDAPLLSAGRLSVHGRHTFFSGPLVIQMDAPDGRQPLRQEGRQAEATCPFHHSVPSTLHRTRRRNRHRQHRRCCYRPFYRRPGRDLLDVGFRFSRHDDKLCGKNARHPLPLSGCKKSLGRRRNGLYGKRASLQMDGSALCSPLYSRLLRHGQPLAEQFNGAGYEKRLRRIPQSDRSSGGHN